MGEPARNLHDIEPDIRPDLYDTNNPDEAARRRRDKIRELNAQESNPEKADKDSSIKNQEESGSNLVQGPWANKVVGAATQVATGGKLSLKNFKKKGPLTAIILTVVGGGIGISSLLSPSLLLVQIKEAVVDRFNTQLTSMDVRTKKIINTKVSKTTSGYCSSVASVLCKYSSLSKTQVAKFQAAGIEVKGNTVALTGRTKPTSYVFDGNEISAKDFSSVYSKNAEFRTAVKTAYNPKYAGFSDSTFSKVLAKFGISKKAVKIDGDTDSEKLTSIQEKTKNSIDGDGKTTVPEVGSEKEGGGTWTQEEVNAINESNALAEAAEESAEKAVKAAPGAFTKAANAVKLTGFIDNACMAYNTVQAVGYAAKTVRVLQLASYAMIFLNVADQIKAGTADSEDVSYLGKILTTNYTGVDEDGNYTSEGTATDSYGYKYAAYGDTGETTDTMLQFMAGGGLTGTLLSVTNIIDTSLKGSAKGTCGFLANPFVGGVMAVGGIAAMLIPGVNAAGAVKIAAQAAASAAIGLAIYSLPALLQDIVAGVLVDETTVGEAAGDAIVSGSSAIMSSAAALGGNSPLTPEQAVAYNELSDQIAAEYAEEDQLAYGQFDITNSNTFLGKIASILTPYVAQISNLPDTISSIASFVTSSLSFLAPSSVNAISAEDYAMCNDYDYRDLGLATDPYCNVIYGIPEEYLEIDPLEVANRLEGQYNEVTGEPSYDSDYDNFVNNCINRTNPLGYDDPNESSDSDGSECLIDSDPMNKYYYLFYIDQRVLTGMEEE